MSGTSLLAGRGAVVSGGSRGIGRAVAGLLCDLGAGVVVNGRDEAAVDATLGALTASGGRATAVVGAADDERIAGALVEECIGAFGTLDVLVNCAGVAEPPGSSILNISAAEFDQLIGAHLGTAFHTCRVAARVMAAQGHGSIVNTSSVAFLGDYGGTGYPAGKGAVNALTMAIAAELKVYGVRANGVCPGSAHAAVHRGRVRGTHRGPASSRAARRGDRAGVAGQRPAEFVAPLYAYLASDLARGVTGQIFMAAGGFVGRFDRPAPRVLGYRDHRDAGPWSTADLHEMLGTGS
ncbi:SDR family NAD(P)-dependent oxidoreductase [Mycobacterium helveticum]|uniref:SDR family NAD(P)-dependent oxidoreductase n=1 Tax=Mycobacterium helveticum TaxID=2592811 RepID=UPI001FEA6F2E|nr:SDR family NAD(P)-dependent oxidoreductase [Mycobacterium helveticum]